MLNKDVPELMLYFQNYKANQFPDRKHMFNILATHKYEELSNIVKIARQNRSLEKPQDENKLVCITKSFYDEIIAVSSQKCTSANFIYLFLVSKGKAAQMLKRSTKLIFNKKPEKKYQLNIASFVREDEEEKDENNIA